MLWANIFIVALSLLLLWPVAIVVLECAASLVWRRKYPLNPAHAGVNRPAVAILIPAHNEESVLADVLVSIREQMQPQDRILVVADNCTDQTAHVALAYGASVVERVDRTRVGKGYALDFGVRHLAENPPRILIMCDADCRIHPGAIDNLVAQVMQTGRPAQACYLLERPRNGKLRDAVSALAFMVKNWVRPAGLVRLGLPCLLTGNGMAFPWEVISAENLASSNIVEDMQLSLDLARQGHAPIFCRDAHVTGKLPLPTKVAYIQRTRWEHGHLQTMLQMVPKLFRDGFKSRNGQMVALACELSVPPLAMLVGLLWVGAILNGVAAYCLGATWVGCGLLSMALLGILLCLMAAWAKFGRWTVPLSSLLGAPAYVLWKLPMYIAFIFNRQTDWVRTSRDGAAAPATGESAISSRNRVHEMLHRLESTQTAMPVKQHSDPRGSSEMNEPGLASLIADAEQLWQLLSLAETNGWPMHVVGDNASQVQQAVNRISRRHPLMTVTGVSPSKIVELARSGDAGLDHGSISPRTEATSERFATSADARYALAVAPMQMVLLTLDPAGRQNLVDQLKQISRQSDWLIVDANLRGAAPQSPGTSRVPNSSSNPLVSEDASDVTVGQFPIAAIARTSGEQVLSFNGIYRSFVSGFWSELIPATIVASKR